MKLIVKNNSGETVSIQIKSNETFMDLKERVEEEAGISLDLKDIALKGKKITETQRVMEYFLSYGEVEEETPTNIYCAVPGCNNTKVSNPDKVFFEFPAEEIRCHQWVLYCQRLNAGPGKKRLNLTSESTICSDHFRPDQFVKNTNTLLKRTAVPCVKMLPSRAPLSKFSKRQDTMATTKMYELDSRNYFLEDSEDSKDGLQLHLRLCRLCSSASAEYISIFDSVGRAMKIAEKIKLCLPMEVQMTDPLPKQICKDCLVELNGLYDLSDMCSLAQVKLENIYDGSSSDEDLTVLSLNDTGGEDLMIGASTTEDMSGRDKLLNCPLCKEGNLVHLGNTKPKEDVVTPLPDLDSFEEMDSLNLEGSDLKNHCMDRSDYSFVSDYSESFSRKKIANVQMMYDSSDLESQVDCSSDFTKESDPLKIDDSSKSDNDQIGECYSSLTSTLNIISSEESSHKNIKEHQLSPIPVELGLDPDLNYLDTESESSFTQPSMGETSSLLKNNTISCRICGMDFDLCIDLLKHCYSHSFKGFYQCVACVSFYPTKEDLDSHFSCHSEEESNVIYCDVCTKSFKSAISLASHICKQEDTSSKCQICNKHFRSESRLRNHLKSHEGPRPTFCNICNKVFPDEIKLQKHNMYIHNNKKSHCCDECGKVFKSEASMKYHQRAHQSDDSVKPYTCERCGKSFIRKSMLINHMTSSHKHVSYETPCFTCKICYEAFPSTAAAVSHMDNHHKVECMDESTYSFEMHTINRLYICEFCERCYAEGNVLNQHRDQHPSDAPYECKLCDTSYPTLEDVLQHHNEHVSDEIPNEYSADFTIPKTYLCEYCERCFLIQVKYTEHLTVHYGPEPYQCRNCTLKFSSLLEAVEHRSLHVDSSPQVEEYNFYRPYECHYCSKTFAIEDALIKHIRMHTGEKPFICDQCGKGFSQSSGLYTHQKVHSSERPYSCSVCPRTFKIKGDRDVHVRKHSGDRPYKCEFCGKAFMTQHVYSQHRKIHTGERPYKCDVCGIAFRRSHVLTVHKRIHTGEKPNICDICGKRYRQKGDMLKHRRIQHGLVNTKNINKIGPELSPS